jgi:phage terminase large subunit
MKHKFDFNKLFSEGVNYQRLSDAQKITEKIRSNIDFSQTISLDSGNLGNFNYFQQRSFTSIGSKSTSSLEDYIRKVQNFVMMTQKSDDWLILELNIESYALRRRLSQALQIMYKDRNAIFTQF